MSSATGEAGSDADDPLASEPFPAPGITEADSRTIFGNNYDVPMPAEDAILTVPGEANTLQGGDHDVLPINYDPLPPLDICSETVGGRPLYENGATILRETGELFPVGKVFQDEATFLEEATKFKQRHNFNWRKESKNRIVCSRAANTNSKKKEAGKIVLQKASSSNCSNCP